MNRYTVYLNRPAPDNQVVVYADRYIAHLDPDGRQHSLIFERDGGQNSVFVDWVAVVADDQHEPEGGTEYPFTTSTWVPIDGQERNIAQVFHSSRDADFYVDGMLVRESRFSGAGHVHHVHDGDNQAADELDPVEAATAVAKDIESAHAAVEEEMQARVDEEAREARRSSWAMVDSFGRGHDVPLYRLIFWARRVSDVLLEEGDERDLQEVLDGLDEEIKRAEEERNEPLMVHLYQANMQPVPGMTLWDFKWSESSFPGYEPQEAHSDDIFDRPRAVFSLKENLLIPQPVLGYFLTRGGRLVGACRFHSNYEFSMAGDTMTVQVDEDKAAKNIGVRS